MENMDDLEIVQKVGSLKPLASGADSVVFSLTRPENPKPSSVLKVYNQGGINSLDPKNETRAVLEEYYADTLKAAKILERNPNPLNQSIEMSRRTYPLKYKIIPQGEVLLEEKGKHYKYDQLEVTHIASYGQEYVEGVNLTGLRNPTMMVGKKQEPFVYDEGVFEQIFQNTNRLFDYLSKQIGVEFTVATMNLKPFLEEDGSVLIIITDLAGNLEDYHQYSPKFAPKGDSK